MPWTVMAFSSASVSGGGTVYHDLGNLNYSVIVNRDAYHEAQAFTMLLEVLAAVR